MIVDKHGDSELMLAADEGKLNIVMELLPTYSLQEINYHNPYGNTALYLAANHGHKTIVELLLAAGADPLIRNQNNHCAASAAYRQDFNNICAILPALSDAEKLELKPPVEEPPPGE